MTIKFDMTPGYRSTGIHILLEEIGLAFEAYPVSPPDLQPGDRAALWKLKALVVVGTAIGWVQRLF